MNSSTLRLTDPDWCLDARTGVTLFERSPESGDDYIDCDPITGRTLGRFSVPWPTTLTGQRSQRRILDVGGRHLTLLIVPRNHGTTLELLDAAKPRWSSPPLYVAADLQPAGICHDGEGLYLVSGGMLTAVALSDGKSLWSRPVDGPRRVWQTQVAGDYILAYPAKWRQLAVAVPLTGGQLEWTLSLSAEDRPGMGVPVLLCERKTGRLVQRLNLPAGTPRFALNRRGTEPQGPVVHVSGGRLLIAANEQIFCLN